MAEIYHIFLKATKFILPYTTHGGRFASWEFLLQIHESQGTINPQITAFPLQGVVFLLQFSDISR